MEGKTEREARGKSAYFGGKNRSFFTYKQFFTDSTFSYINYEKI